ncbi:hypothetical protein P256_01947 [Acinetobacter nectaris CIP 110549]|uniref:Tail specific protease domain-containing protein n=1 Tax=Acinetobacter nectaris CIP 110549 TaxID=1392540 RepID=V2T7X0_9GAMM|nr:S41 family peptidase [Acinetobacter nectaris]ESK38408.1 hypothetical protein P256_01947 [Acinetobacter nectaris CIP 110549]
MIHQLKKLGILLGLLGCMNHSILAATSDDRSQNSDYDLDEKTLHSQEVPVDEIQRFVQIYALIKDNYVRETSDDELFEQAIKGLVSGLDRYSRYLTPTEYHQLIQYTDGDVATVDFDLSLDRAQRQWYIRGVRPNSDSAKLGIHNGMPVYKLDNTELKDLNPNQVKNILLGAVGTVINVQVAPVGQPITVVRNKKIEVEIATTLLKNQVLVIKVPVFQQETASEIKSILEQYANSKVKAVLFDLSNNPGGLLSAAVETADLFLNNGIIVTTRSRSEGSQTFQALPSKEFEGLKLGILINSRSASAAEVFTAALKEHQRAWVLGEKSYGKGVVQKLFPLPNGAAVQMTVSHYFTPNGNMIDGRGIQPDQSMPRLANIKDNTYLENVADALLKH